MSGLSSHFKGTTVAPITPALDMSQPNRWSEDEKKAYGGYHTALGKWEQDKNVAHAQIMSPIGDSLIMKTYACTTVVLMWKSLHEEFEGKPHLYAIDIWHHMMQKRAKTSDNMHTHLDK